MSDAVAAISGIFRSRVLRTTFFYSPKPEKDELRVIAVWSMVRGKGPPLRLV